MPGGPPPSRRTAPRQCGQLTARVVIGAVVVGMGDQLPPHRRERHTLQHAGDAVEGTAPGVVGRFRDGAPEVAVRVRFADQQPVQTGDDEDPADQRCGSSQGQAASGSGVLACGARDYTEACGAQGLDLGHLDHEAMVSAGRHHSRAAVSRSTSARSISPDNAMCDRPQRQPAVGVSLNVDAPGVDLNGCPAPDVDPSPVSDDFAPRAPPPTVGHRGGRVRRACRDESPM